MEGFKKNDRWTDEEVQALLSIYGDDETQRHFESATRNDKVYQLITAKLAELSIFHTQKQVREKLKKLKQDYKKLKDHNNRSGNDRKINKWYERLDVILGHRMGCTTGKTKDSAIAMLEAMCEDTAVGEDSSPTDTLTHQAGPSLSSSLPSDVSLSSPVSVEALEGISEDGPSTSGNCAPLSTSTSNDEVSEHSRPTSRISRAVPESSALLSRPAKRKRDRDHLFLDYLREFDEKNGEATRAMFLEEVRLHKEDLELRRQERKEDLEIRRRERTEDQQLARELIEQNHRHDRDFQMGFLAALNRFVDTMSKMPK
ncbi:uncharacterized protein LOC144007546 [Festucalex cinctus]